MGSIGGHTHVHIETSSPDATYPIWVDWYLIRKYVEPEPTHGAWGNEET